MNGTQDDTEGSLNVGLASAEIEGPKPISARIAGRDIQVLFATQCSPEGFNQCILAALKDAGAPVEGTLRLKLAHGAIAKVKTSPYIEQEYFEYLWLPELYVATIAALQLDEPVQ